MIDANAITSGTSGQERREHEGKDDERADTADHRLGQHTRAAAVAAVFGQCVEARQVDRFARHAYAGDGRARRLGGLGFSPKLEAGPGRGKRARTRCGRPSGPTPRYRWTRRTRSARRAAPRSGARRRVAGPFGRRGCPPSCRRGASPRAPAGYCRCGRCRSARRSRRSSSSPPCPGPRTPPAAPSKRGPQRRPRSSAQFTRVRRGACA